MVSKYKPCAGAETPACERFLLSTIVLNSSSVSLCLPTNKSVPTMERTMLCKNRLAVILKNHSSLFS